MRLDRKLIIIVNNGSSFLEQLSCHHPLLPDMHDFPVDMIGQIQNERSSQHLPAADIATNKSIEHVIITFQIGERNVRIFPGTRTVCLLTR